MSNFINPLIPTRHHGNVVDRSDKILSIIFSGQQDHMEESFSVFNSIGNNTGKIYLPLTVSLKPLMEANLGFHIDAEVRQSKVVLHY